MSLPTCPDCGSGNIATDCPRELLSAYVEMFGPAGVLLAVQRYILHCASCGLSFDLAGHRRGKNPPAIEVEFRSLNTDLQKKG